MKYKTLVKKLEKSLYLSPAVKIRLECTGDIGIVIRLCEPVGNYNGGDTIIFWNDGEIATLDESDEIELLHSDLFDEGVKE
jgi:hypothetical protein